MEVSFIIPHKGREEMLQLTLASIAQLDYSPADMEVIVVTQNAEPIDSAKYADSLPNLTSIQCSPEMTISMLRNKGVAAAQGKYLAFLDADVALSNNWLTAMLNTLQQHPSRVLVSAMQQCAKDAPVLEKIRTALSNATIDAAVRFLPGRNLFMAKATFVAAGGFPEHLVTCEDYYFTDKVSQLGELYYTSAATYVHLGEDKRLNEMFKKEIWRGQSNLSSLKGRKIPLEEVPSFLVPLWILIFFAVIVVGIVTASMTLLLTGLTLTLAPILIYTQRLFRLCKGTVNYTDVLKFYLTYFPARVIGTLSGLAQFFKASK